MAKNGHVHEGGKVGRSNATHIKLFSVDFYDLKSMSFKLGNDIFITFEMPRMVTYIMAFWKANTSLLFCPFDSEVLDSPSFGYTVQLGDKEILVTLKLFLNAKCSLSL